MSIPTMAFHGANNPRSEVVRKILDGSALATCLAVPPAFPLVLVANANLPGMASRFDYQDIDATNGYLVIAHMDDNSVVFVNLSGGSPVQVLSNIPVPRGVAVASSVGRIFVTSSGPVNQLYIFDSTSLNQIGTAITGNAPDGVSWDPTDMIVGVSDQGDGAVSLITGSGSGTRTQVILFCRGNRQRPLRRIT
jgi:DNA-binding beta-propeller fold protein YncE